MPHPGKSAARNGKKARKLLDLCSGTPFLDKDRWIRTLSIVKRISEVKEIFLVSWASRMAATGYLEFTMANKADSEGALNLFIDTILGHADHEEPPTFEYLLKQESDQGKGWAHKLLGLALRHRQRGITSPMFMGCFKLLYYAIVDALRTLQPAPDADPKALAEFKNEVEDACVLLRMYVDAFEMLWMDVCIATQQHEQIYDYGTLCRMLTFEKCRFESVIDSISDCILIIDTECRVKSVNRAFRLISPLPVVNDLFLWEALPLDCKNPEAFFKFHPIGESMELTPFDNNTFFRMQVISLGDINLASEEFLVLLTNITPQVMQRQALEQMVEERTAQLLEEKQAVADMNTTLRGVLHTVEVDRQYLVREVSEKIQQVVLPLLSRLEAESREETRRAYVRIVRDQIDPILSDKKNDTPALSGLTVTEMRVCQYLKAGHSSKEIAGLMHITHDTVQAHRRNIRRKLGISGKKSQLGAFLQGLPK